MSNENLDKQILEIKSLNKRIEKLEKADHCQMPDCTGGMLSSSDFLELVFHKKRQNSDGNYNSLEENFKQRNWDAVNNKIIIEPFDELNLTPFSYDLSIGRDVVSVRSSERIRSPLPYDLEPGETIIVLTSEFIALPPHYAATVWPRFSLVREGIFQSMVKIDPTWFGHLAVAMNNFSPRIFTLKQGMPFGTLILYGLSSRTDMDLYDPKDIDPVTVSVANVVAKNILSGKLDKFENIAWLEGDDLKVRALKQSDYIELRAVDLSQPWKDAVDEARKKWLEASYTDPSENARKKIGVNGLGMTDLSNITKGSPKGKPIEKDELQKINVSYDMLEKAAIQQGKPFNLIYGLPEMIKQSVKESINSEIEAIVGRDVYPNIITLVFRIIASLSLVVGVIAFGIKVMLGTKNVELEKLALLGLIFYGITIIILTLFICRIARTKNSAPRGRGSKKEITRILKEVKTCLSGKGRPHKKSKEENNKNQDNSIS